MQITTFLVAAAVVVVVVAAIFGVVAVSSTVNESMHLVLLSFKCRNARKRINCAMIKKTFCLSSLEKVIV